MKKILLFIAIMSILLSGCNKINESLDSLNERIEKLENVTISSVDKQINAIRTSLTTLDSTDKELKIYINKLQSKSESLQSCINETNIKIDNIKNELLDEITTAEADLIAQLESLKGELNIELKQIDSTIVTLKEKDAVLEQKITNLNSYIDTELKDTKDWASTTFTTLEQYNSLVGEITTIKSLIESTNKSIVDLETRTNDKIKNDIANAVSSLSSDLQQAIQDITSAYSNAISTAKSEITTAYTSALENTISSLETSLKNWVNERLTSYSTIAETEAKIDALKNETNNQLNNQKIYLEALIEILSQKTDDDISELEKTLEDINTKINQNISDIAKLNEELQKQKEEITLAYQNAITEAITESEGKMNQELANEIAALNERIENSDISAIEKLVEQLNSRLENIESAITSIQSEILEIKNKIESIVSHTQSVTYVPQFSNGKVAVDYHTKKTVIDFYITPKSVISDLDNVWQTALSVKAIPTEIRSSSFVELSISSYQSNINEGTITLEIDATNLEDAGFFREETEASLTLNIEEGYNNVSSNFAPLTLVNNNIVFEDQHTEYVCLQWDINKNGKLSYYEASLVNSLENAWGNTSIKYFNELKYFTNLKTIGSHAFLYYSYLETIELPSSVCSIEERAFYDCRNLDNINLCNVNYIGDDVFMNTSLNSINLENAVSIGEYAFDMCSELDSITIGKNISSIGHGAFISAKSDLNVYIKANTPPTLGSLVFYKGNYTTAIPQYYISSNLKIYVPTESVEEYKSQWPEYKNNIYGYEF